MFEDDTALKQGMGHFAFQLPAHEGCVESGADHLLRHQLPVLVRIENADVCTCSGLNPTIRKAQDIGRIAGQARQSLGQGENMLIHQLQSQREKRFEAGYARQGGWEGGFLGVRLVRLMI